MPVTDEAQRSVAVDPAAHDVLRIKAAIYLSLGRAEVERWVLDEEYTATQEEHGRSYSERIYNVLWQRPDEWHPDREDRYGTHRVNINSKGEFMVIWGHYDMDARAALKDLIDRTPKLRGLEWADALRKLSGFNPADHRPEEG